MSSSTRIAISIATVVVLAGAFWLLLLSPARQRSDDLGTEVEQLNSSLAASQSRAAEGRATRKKFPVDYQQLVLLGKAVPGSDETSSLLIQLNQIADRSHVRFESIKLGAGSEEEASATAAETPASPSATPATPTEAAAALLPIGATIGSAGLGVMPYDLTFRGDFFHVADFIKGIDALVESKKGSHIAVDGRLMTLNGFSLTPESEKLDGSGLKAAFSVTTYLVPPFQGVTAGASPSSPEEVPATESAPETASPAPAGTTAATTEGEAR